MRDTETGQRNEGDDEAWTFIYSTHWVRLQVTGELFYVRGQQEEAYDIIFIIIMCVSMVGRQTCATFSPILDDMCRVP